LENEIESFVRGLRDISLEGHQGGSVEGVDFLEVRDAILMRSYFSLQILTLLPPIDLIVHIISNEK
jgi:hypothetical protein